MTNLLLSLHTKAGKKAAKKKLHHFDMDTYPLGGHHATTIGFTIQGVLGRSGKKPTMPFDKPGSMQGDDLARIKAWTDAWEAADKAVSVVVAIFAWRRRGRLGHSRCTS